MTAFFRPENALASLAEGAGLQACLGSLFHYLRAGSPERASERMDTLVRHLRDRPEQARRLAEGIFGRFSRLEIYPALVRLGILSREGLLREITTRLYDRLNPPPVDREDSSDLLASLITRHDKPWLEALPAVAWLRLARVLLAALGPDTRHQARVHLEDECLYALEMLAIWVAAEELDPELMRIDARLTRIDSPLIALQREVHAFVERRSAPQDGIGSDETEALDHLWVMLDQCREQVARFRRRGAGSLGSSANASHLIERLEETLKRIEKLVVLIGPQYRVAGPRTALQLWQELLLATAEKDSIRAVWKKSTRMVSRSVTQNKSDHGERYISRDLPSYLRLFATAAGAGVIIAVMALIKITIESWGLAPLPQAVLVSLNYGLGFVLIHLLHFTIATKQPAMTAASFAAEVERNRHGKALGRKLARLLRDVNRSQWGAVWGNVAAALATAFAITAATLAVSGQALFSSEQIAYQLRAISPLHSLALFYAAIAGVWLFCAGIMAGFFDNRADHIRLERRLVGHPALQRLSPTRRERLAHYLHHNYGALAGNFLFGVLLGMTGYLGYLLGLPLDIRHVAFASANLGFASFSDFQGWGSFLVGLLFVMMIGFVNLWVSFALALMVALRSRGCRIESSTLLSGVKEEFRREPLRFFLPTVRSSRKGGAGAGHQERQ
ncbi:recombinase [Halomonas campisalis]|uniref:Recombinase n=1 Tax=Billgrantia campisalis TaxID=74661 RepID=A0ABS9P7P5_9GAMM|nr:site-specific recombinase [Halomonas campisalis]MCG6657812.1 recombinase [Halomonas campisalis]MDR5864716.1 site-specific recombinase [Halomonas campisalis]